MTWKTAPKPRDLPSPTTHRIDPAANPDRSRSRRDPLAELSLTDVRRSSPDPRDDLSFLGLMGGRPERTAELRAQHWPLQEVD